MFLKLSRDSFGTMSKNVQVHGDFSLRPAILNLNYCGGPARHRGERISIIQKNQQSSNHHKKSKQIDCSVYQSMLSPSTNNQ